jgi:streptogramin lyase
MMKRSVSVLALAATLALSLPRAASAGDPNHVFVPCAGTPEVDRVSLDGDVVPLRLSASTLRSVAIGADGTVYVASFAPEILALDREGTPLGKWNLPASAIAIAVDRDDAVWAVVGSGTGAVLKLSREGEPAVNVTGLSLPSGLAIDGRNRAWVADVGTDKLLRVSSAGEVERVVAAPSCPREVAVDRRGHVWVGTQCPQPRLLEFDPEGELLASHAVPGTILGSIAVDARGDVWASTPLTGSIHHYAPDGTLLSSFGGIPSATSIAVDGEGMLWITGDNARLVTRFDPDAGAVVATVRTGDGPRGRGDMTGFVRASIVDPEGDADGDEFTNRREIDLGTNPFSSASVPYHWLAGNVSLGTGRTQDVLFVNDSAWRPERRVTLPTWEPVFVFVDAPALAIGPTPFALYAMPGLSVEDAVPVEQPFGIGTSAFPTPLSGGEPQPIVIANGFRSRHAPEAGTPRIGAASAPMIVRSFPSGFGRPIRVVLQGIIADPGSAGPGYSVTNAVGVDVR